MDKNRLKMDPKKDKTGQKMTSRKDSPGIFNRFKVLQKSAKLSLECHKLLKISSHRQSKAFTDQKLKGD